MKKRMIALLMILVLGLSCLTACGDKDDDEKKGYHKGKIFVKSSVVGQGTTFRITLKK